MESRKQRQQHVGAEGGEGKRENRQVVILIRGYPGVGKTTVAMAIAKKLGYCLICKDDVREAALRHDQRVRSDIERVYGEETGNGKMRVDSNDMTYEAMFAVGMTQLRVGMSGVVLESPLGRVALGKRALEVARTMKAMCVLVDCYAERRVWESRLLQRKRNEGEFRMTDVDAIERRYENLHYEMECDAHVHVDCGLAVDENVGVVEGIVRQLRWEER